MASWFIRDNILKARDEGMGVMLLSGDLEELFYLADRLVVMFKGKIIGEVDPRHTTVQEVGSLMMGASGTDLYGRNRCGGSRCHGFRTNPCDSYVFAVKRGTSYK